MNKIAGIILAAGKGKRMNAGEINKVVFALGGKQMILHTVNRLFGLKIKPIIVVVGFAKKSVMKILDEKVVFAEQKKQLGTAHAVATALKKLSKNVKTVLVLNGDDSAFYSEDLIKYLIITHFNSKASLSFLTIIVDNPTGLGRVLRDNNGKVIKIIEEKDATEKKRQICEINPGCYIFEVSFLKKYLKFVEKSRISREYYLTSLIDIAIKNKENLEVVEGGRILWRGINTHEELKEAERLFVNIK